MTGALADAHAHGHPHAHAEGGWAPSRPGSVLLDIGGDTGALVVLVPAELAGAEIEAEPVDRPAPAPLVHTAVRERLMPGGTLHAAVFPSLPSGGYRLHRRGAPPGTPPLATASVPPAAVGECEVGGER